MLGVRRRSLYGDRTGVRLRLMARVPSTAHGHVRPVTSRSTTPPGPTDPAVTAGPFTSFLLGPVVRRGQPGHHPRPPMDSRSKRTLRPGRAADSGRSARSGWAAPRAGRRRRAPRLRARSTPGPTERGPVRRHPDDSRRQSAGSAPDAFASRAPPSRSSAVGELVGPGGGAGDEVGDAEPVRQQERRCSSGRSTRGVNPDRWSAGQNRLPGLAK